jgi:hypothetical protein
VLDVWDRAGIDFSQWQRWKKASGLYFMSREPSGEVLSVATGFLREVVGIDLR